jgi:hypothetical protein
MASYKSSIDALQQLLQLGTPEGKISDKINSNFVHCQITKASKNISYAKNGIQYFFVEVTCSDGTQYGLQAYGEEANELYKEAYRCVMCGKPAKEKGSAIIEQSVDGKNFLYDSNGCALIFRRLSIVMGEENAAGLLP